MTDLEKIELIRTSGLFSTEWYLGTNPDIRAAGVDPVVHWYFNALSERRNPNPFFSVSYYLDTNPEVRERQVNPLYHYITEGEKAGRKPSLLFDPTWYSVSHDLPEDPSYLTALSHYLDHQRDPDFSPNPHFSTRHYVTRYPDVLASELPPYEHFINNGVYEGRDPSPSYSTRFYSKRNRIPAGENPFLHYLAIGHAAGLISHPAAEKTVYSELSKWTSPGPFFKEVPKGQAPSRNPPVDAFAFYLPQFHPIPENDYAWGNGFTEWRNIARGLPKFEGHYQPRIPRDLGFYDLRAPSTIEDQSQLAHLAGLKGFAFYYYNFDGKRVLDLPIELFMESETPLNFFLIWANENWTRAWDGFDKDVILKQEYSKERVSRIASDVARHMRHSRYYRIGGQPLLIIYRPGIIPDPARYLNALRDAITSELGETPLLFMAQGFGDYDPRQYGLDGAMEFPPHKIGEGLEPINQRLNFFDYAYTGNVLSYQQHVERSLEVEKAEFPLIRGAMPMWDNEARRPGRGTVIHGSTPALYKNWLSKLVNYSLSNPIKGHSVVVINAWNEWCEGTYLEPDVHYGSAYLRATAEAILESSSAPALHSVLLFGHDAHRHGAQLLLLNVARQLKFFGYRVAIVLWHGGPLESEYRAISDYFAVVESEGELRSLLMSPDLREYRFAITNTVVAGNSVPILKEACFDVVSLVHEMANIIRERNLGDRCQAISANSDAVVFPARSVLGDFTSITGKTPERAVILPQGIYHAPAIYSNAIASDKKIPRIVNAGYADLRKGFDIFVATADYFYENGIPGDFIWIGNIDPSIAGWIKPKGSNFKHVPFTDDIHSHLVECDCFYLTSREDPFPSVALEGAAVGMPIICFAGAGGISELVEADSRLGGIVDGFSVVNASAEIQRQLQLNGELERNARIDEMLKTYSFSHYITRLLQLLGAANETVSVVVPNYNYANYLDSRIRSIVQQSYRPSQIFVLDDCSKDNSQSVINRIGQEFRPWINTRYNNKNSGSPFPQWAKGTSLASGKYIWIAEADDYSEPRFLETTINFMEAYGCSFCFTDSKQIGADGEGLSESYSYYFETVDSDLFGNNFVMGGRQFLEKAIGVKNLILNVSSVVWRRDVLQEALSKLERPLREFKVAGDWRIYAHVCSQPSCKVGYIARSLNVHRRHESSATHAQARMAQLKEVERMHTLIQKLSYGGTADLSGMQRSYREELKRQFGII